MGGGAQFSLGQVVATPAALEALQAAGNTAVELLEKHQRGDWGDVCEEDKRLNREAVENGSRILSSYKLSGETTIWIITEADRSSTCLLLPDEY